MFDDLAEHGWAQSHDLITPAWAQDLALQCQKLHDSGVFTQAAVGHGSTKSVHTQIRGDSTLWLEDSQSPALQSEVSNFLTELMQELNQTLFLGLKRFESHFAWYPPGSGYQKHIDNHQGLSHRRVTFVLYLNENWQNADGGELSLFAPDEPDKKIHSIKPQLGNFVLFRSELFPHQVEESFKVRKSLTGWFRDDAL
ncbi:2OG-Fe(II) oxygenase superfamily protein [compost metagenome]